jgi:hypothetical protein
MVKYTKKVAEKISSYKISSFSQKQKKVENIEPSNGFIVNQLNF